MRFASTLLASCFALAFASGASAQDYERTDLGNRVPDKAELIELLKVPPPLPTRGGEPAPPPKPRAISNSIGFEVNSDVLTERGKEFLNNLGAALSDEALANSRLLLEGHADARGEEKHNLELSKRRAQAVQKFLVDVWGVPAQNLSAVGKGESDLLDKANPDSESNRAVVIVNTGTRADGT